MCVWGGVDIARSLIYLLELILTIHLLSLSTFFCRILEEFGAERLAPLGMGDDSVALEEVR